MKSLILFIMLFPSMLLAQPFENQFQGSYYLDSNIRSPVNFTLSWTEKNNEIKGVYTDSYYTAKSDVTGKIDENGRSFIVNIPQISNGIKSILLLSGKENKSMPISIITRDKVGNPLTTAKSQASYVKRITMEAQEEGPCEENFGALAGFCGNYITMVTEETDAESRCTLQRANRIILTLTSDGTFVLYLDRPSDIIAVPNHEIGRLNANPASTNIDVMSRSCRPLADTNFPGDDCKRLNLRGTFTIEEGRKRFKGTYSIINEKTNSSCSYSLSSNLEP